MQLYLFSSPLISPYILLIRLKLMICLTRARHEDLLSISSREYFLRILFYSWW
jgi:hypothetical protein